MAWREWLEKLRARRRSRDRAAGFFDARGVDVLPTVGASFCTADIDAVTGGGTGVFHLEVFLVRDSRAAADAPSVVVQARDGRRLAYLDRAECVAFEAALEMIRADALVKATVSRSAPEHSWVVTLHVDRPLLDELGAEAAGGLGDEGGEGADEGDDGDNGRDVVSRRA